MERLQKGQEVMSSPGAVVQVLDVSWREGLQGQRVVDGDGDPARCGGTPAENLTDLCLEGKMAAVVLRHLHPVHPLQRDGPESVNVDAYICMFVCLSQILQLTFAFILGTGMLIQDSF